MGFEIGHNKGVEFGKGQDPTKGGAPKGKRVSTIIKDLLTGNAKAFSKNKDYLELDGNTAMAVELITMAFDKDNTSKDKLSAIKEIMDRIEGKSIQHQIIEEKKLVTSVTIKTAKSE